MDQRHTFKTLIYIEHLSFIKMATTELAEIDFLCFQKKNSQCCGYPQCGFRAQRWLIIHQYHREEIFANIFRVQIGIPVEVVHVLSKVHLLRWGPLSGLGGSWT